jgi:Gram-negative bacterial TonB protein C-terminal
MKNFHHTCSLFAVLAGITLSFAAAAQQGDKPQPSNVGGSWGTGPGWPDLQNCRQFKGQTVCRVGGEVSAPRLIFPEQRDHQPPTLFTNSTSIPCPCTAAVWAVVGRDGLVHYPRIIRSVDTELDRRAIEWMQKWKFEYGRKSNKAVAVETNLEVKFR